jgi:hypothetical protein
MSNRTIPSPHLELALPPVRGKPILAPLNGGEGRGEEAHTKLAAVSALLQGPAPEEGRPEQALPAQLVQQQLYLLHHFGELHQQSMRLQIQKMLCAAALTSSTSQTLAGYDTNASQISVLQQLALLSPEEQMALHFNLGSTRLLYPGAGAPACAWPLVPEMISKPTEMGRTKAGGRRRNFHGKQAVACLQEWLHANVKNPYPSLEVKRALANTSGLTIDQVDHWFNNARKRRIKAGGKPKKENLNPSDAAHVEHPAKCSVGGPPKNEEGEKNEQKPQSNVAAGLVLRVE